VLRIECDKCGRAGNYRLARLIAKYGLDAKLFDWSDEITADCPRKQARNLNDQCGGARIYQGWYRGPPPNNCPDSIIACCCIGRIASLGPENRFPAPFPPRQSSFVVVTGARCDGQGREWSQEFENTCGVRYRKNSLRLPWLDL
jgi:hypothetical protein